ncbi:MAG TPA: glutathione S-transferase N-terminal domain-containing protein [Alphaproteobacteria bacterium]|nr:glutathione S-transferase N-terminal domain-containing protein [Alphaproteobacteria bacterium]
MPALKLYHSPGACSMACHVALEEAGAAFEPVVIRLSEGANHTPEYRAIHPRGFLPVLEFPDGRRLTEAAAILLAVARRHPGSRLLPDAGTFEEARVFEWLAWLTNTVHVAYAGLWRPERFTDDPGARTALAAEAKDRIAALDADAASRLGSAPFAAGDAYTVADAFLLVFFRWSNRIGLDAAGRHPAWAAWARRMEARPAVARVLAREGVSLWE